MCEVAARLIKVINELRAAGLHESAEIVQAAKAEIEWLEPSNARLWNALKTIVRDGGTAGDIAKRALAEEIAVGRKHLHG